MFVVIDTVTRMIVALSADTAALVDSCRYPNRKLVFIGRDIKATFNSK